MSGKLRLGTSAFTAAGWPGTFYPEDLKPAEYLSYYAQHFDTVEVDSTYYRIPSLSMTRGWNAKTPNGFLFALKMVSTITHEKVLVDCESELKAFLAAADALGEKLGPILWQFPPWLGFGHDRFADFIEMLPRTSAQASALANEHNLRQKNWIWTE